MAMRSKVIIPLLFLVMLSGISFCYLRLRNRSAVAENKVAASHLSQQQATEAADNTAPETIASQPAALATPSEVAAVPVRGTIAEHETYVEKRVAELQDLAMDDDPKSLQIILSELTNRDPEIRQAAVDATMQFGSRDAIPKLTDAALQTDDAAERAAILQAAEFLKLPSYRETQSDTPNPKSAATKARSLKTTPNPSPPR